MTATHIIDPQQFLHEQLALASPDLMRERLETFVNALLSTQAGTQERTNRRNGYRHRDLDTRVGTLDVAVPKLRERSFFPDWLLTRRRRSEAALTTVVATCYLLGVSTRRTDKLVRTLGITGLSKSQVSEMAKDLDEQVAAFRTRPLKDGPYTLLAGLDPTSIFRQRRMTSSGHPMTLWHVYEVHRAGQAEGRLAVVATIGRISCVVPAANEKARSHSRCKPLEHAHHRAPSLTGEANSWRCTMRSKTATASGRAASSRSKSGVWCAPTRVAPTMQYVASPPALWTARIRALASSLTPT